MTASGAPRGMFAFAGVLGLVGAALWMSPQSSQEQESPGPRWLAGDHHIHSRYSVGWDTKTDPPTPIIGGDAIYPIPMNAIMARHHGLSWMVATDHGGPNHSRVSLERTYPELVQSREVVPEVVQFFGMELDTPGADHSSLIVPHTHDEAQRLSDLESRFAKREPWPADSTRDDPARMVEALTVMQAMQDRPVVIANHPSRSASDVGVYGLDEPAEFRDWNDAGPDVAVGMAGAPGHQAGAMNRDGTVADSTTARVSRGAYGQSPTLGGFDQLTAWLGGFWDSMLGEGRRWWITANSDSHVNWREGGIDFWPGEYSKTYVWANKNHDSILAALRAGRVFVTTGDLVSELHVTARIPGASDSAEIGGVLEVPAGATVEITVRWLDPETPNHHGANPSVARVDVISGDVTGPVADRSTDTNPSTRVMARYGPSEWERDGAYRVVTYRLANVASDRYVRVRGTNGAEMEPLPDPRGEDPWSDLWFYSNPIFIHVH
ncbi:MAG TPA: hypothetical protein VLA36_15340 [Longimicrobiales bacterium]|nr:hypothetical protein [Longimicrobiales bacterium]